MTASYTSATAHREHILNGKANSQVQRILNLMLAKDGPLSRSEIALYFDVAPHTWDHGSVIPLASVCGRVNTLIESGLIRVAREDRDPTTGHKVQYLAPVRPEPGQKSFDGFRPPESQVAVPPGRSRGRSLSTGSGLA